jgi:rubrerythrin
MSDPMELVTVYKAASLAEAHLVKNLLLDEEIEAYVAEENEALAGLTFNQSDVFVRREDETRALAIVDQYEDAQIERGERPDWTCPKCGATVLGALDECESCGAVRPGSEDPAEGDVLDEEEDTSE